MYEPLFRLLLLAPFVALILIGLLLPVGQALRESLFSGDGFGAPYREVAADPVFWRVLLRTFRTAAIVSALCLLLAYPTAEMIHRASPRVRPFLLGLVVVPLWSSVIARTYGWIGIFQKDGVLDRISNALGGGDLQLLYTQLAVVVGMVHVLLPLVLLPVYAALARYDSRLSFASSSLGGGKLRTLLMVKLPVLGPQLAAATIGVFVLSLGFFVTPAVLGGPKAQLISTLVAQEIFQTFDLRAAQAMSIVLLLTTLATLAVLAGGLSLWRRAK